MKIKRLHFKYIIVIEALLLIVLFTRIGAPDTSLTNYISFAATISSLILAVLAIIQGFFSSNSLNETVSSLSNSSVTLASGTGRLEELITDLKEELRTNTNKLTNIEENIKNNAKSLIPETASTKLDQNSPPETIFLKRNSPFGNLIMYVIFLSFTKKMFFSLDIFVHEQSNWRSYSYGYIAVLHINQIIKADWELLDSKNGDKIKVLEIKAEFFDEIEKTVKKEIKDKPDLKKHFIKIVDFFNTADEETE